MDPTSKLDGINVGMPCNFIWMGIDGIKEAGKKIPDKKKERYDR